MIAEQLCQEVAASLWAIFHERSDAPHLIWPMKRNNSPRVSEQESKILITQWLEHKGKFYSIETPTRETYTQSGNAAMSALIDVTIYGTRDPADRVLNVELKAGTPSLEAFRKDFEKLLRERVPGLWFHTLTNANDATWDSIEAKMYESLDRLLEHTGLATHTVHFAFCVLERPQLVEFDLDFSTDWRDHLSRLFRFARANPQRPSWIPVAKPLRALAPRSQPASYSGPQRKALIYMPSIEPSSFIHLSAKGESYALRSFDKARPGFRWVEPNCKTTTDLLDRHPIKLEVDVGKVKKNLVSERDYWSARVAELNSEHGIG